MSESQVQGIALASALGSTAAHLLAPARFKPVTRPLLISSVGLLGLVVIDELFGRKLSVELHGMSPTTLAVGESAWLLGEAANFSKFRDESVLIALQTTSGPTAVVPLQPERHDSQTFVVRGLADRPLGCPSLTRPVRYHWGRLPLRQHNRREFHPSHRDLISTLCFALLGLAGLRSATLCYAALH